MKTRMELVDAGEFKKLFLEELGWDRPDHADLHIDVEGEIYTLRQVAGFAGLRVWACDVVPDRRAQRLIDKELQKVSVERLTIYANDTRQEWRWPQSADSTGTGHTRLTLHKHFVGNPNEALRQRLAEIAIPIDTTPSLLDVLKRMRRAWDADAVTRRFYGEFVRQQSQLSAAIEGMPDTVERDWYSALLMNRLMFIYFMQKKGFMDGDPHYLRNRLEMVQALNGKGQSYTFYRDFLLPLFHQGLGSAEPTYANDEIAGLIGHVRYINGGIFSLHELESSHTLQVPDELFQSIFTLFDRYQWHLDDRPSSPSNEINPDVLGYIFEQFVNEKESQDDKGAYYTKEDVTNFMVDNTLIPVFLDRLANVTSTDPWALLRADPARYIWSSLAWAVNVPFPPEVEAERALAVRPTWSSPASDDIGLPSETWWEVDRRRDEYAALTERLMSGEITNSDRAITENLNLELLAIDVLDSMEDSTHAIQAWDVLSSLRVIDPTCGSGAFLFAALRTLQNLYQATLDVIERHSAATPFDEGARLLERVAAHPSSDYFILKHASLSNIYGVDIMREAVEIARLRLFLKLVAAVDEPTQLEPLPDLDFNIKAGNALVGALDLDTLRRDVTDLFTRSTTEAIVDDKAEAFAVYSTYRTAQEDNANPAELAELRASLLAKMDALRQAANRLYHSTGRDRNLPFDDWVQSRSPFHWFIEFPELEDAGGFDVCVGNPPYVNRADLDYTVAGFETDSVSDIYASCCERSAQITRPDGRLSLIVPIRAQFRSDDKPLRDYYSRRFGTIWVAAFQERPAALFQVKVRSTIITAGGSSTSSATTWTTLTHSWVSAFRPHLLNTLRYVGLESASRWAGWMRVSSVKMLELLSELRKHGALSDALVRASEYQVGFKKTATYYLTTYLDAPPTYKKNGDVVPLNAGHLDAYDEEDQLAVSAVLASRLAFLWWSFNGDCFNVTKTTLQSIPFSVRNCDPATRAALIELGGRLREAQRNALSWDLNSGRYVGGYLMPELLDLTSEADELMLGSIGRQDLLPEVEYAFRRMSKSTGNSATTVRSLPFQVAP